MIKKSALYSLWKFLLGVSILVFLSGSNLAPTQKVVLFALRQHKDFQAVYQYMSNEMKKYDLKQMIVDENTTFDDFSKKVKEVHPDLMILMDNKSVELGMKWNLTESTKISGIALMGINFQAILKGNPYISGIAYEVPGYSLVTRFRSYVDRSIKNVLTFYRKSKFQEIVDQTTQQMSQENIKLYAIDVEQEGKSVDQIEAFIRKNVPQYLAEVGKYDVLSLMLDSTIFSKKLWVEFWLPVGKTAKIPFLVGVEQFVLPALEFGSFAVTPNLPDLSSQAVQMVDQILEENQSPDKIGVEQLISVDKSINLKKLKELGIEVRKDKLSGAKVFE